MKRILVVATTALSVILLVLGRVTEGRSALCDNLAWVEFVRSASGEGFTISSGTSCSSCSDLAHSRLGALAAYFSGEYDTAAALFSRAIALSPTDDLLHFFVGNSHSQCGDVDQAIEHWQKAGAARFLLHQCEMSWHRGQLENVLSQCALATEVDPRMTLAYDYLGRASVSMHEYQRATEFYDQAIALEDSASLVYVHAAYAYQRLGEAEIAERYYLLGIELDPQYDGGHYLLGTLYLEQGRCGEAEKHLLEAVRLNAGRVNSMISLGDLYCAMHDAGKAEAHYRLAYDLAPDAQGVQERLSWSAAGCCPDLEVLPRCQ